MRASPSSACSSCSRPPLSIAQWMPHSFGAFVSHHQRPARLGLARLRSRGCRARSRSTCSPCRRASGTGTSRSRDVVPDLLLGPLGERVQLHDRAVVVVDLDLADVRAARPLVAAQAGDPGVERVRGAWSAAAPCARCSRAAAGRRRVLKRSTPCLPVIALDLVPRRARAARAAAPGSGRAAGRPARASPAGSRPVSTLKTGIVGVDLVRHVDQRDAVDLERGRDARCAARTARSPTRAPPAAPRPRTRSTARPPRARRATRRAHDRHLRSLRLLPLTRPLAGSRPASSPSSSSVARRVNAVKLSPSARRVEPARDSPSTAASSSSVGTRRNSERPIAALGPEAAADEDVVGLAPHAALVARGRALEAEVADPVLRAGVRAAVEVQPQVGDLRRRSARSRLSISAPSRVFVSATEKLQCGSPVHAIELPRTGLMSSGKPIALERRPSPRRRARSGRR